MKREHVVIFVPGIMGSELTFEGEGPLLSRIHERVWSGDASVLVNTLGTTPQRLFLPNPLTVGAIIRRITAPGLVSRSVYEKPLQHLTSLGYAEGESLFPFAYDWRLSNLLTADRLAQFIQTVIPAGRPICYVAHSMGGLIVRLLLANPTYADIATRTASFIQIGVPGLGSSRAFYTLKKRPELGALMTSLLKLVWKIKAEAYHNLMQALVTFDSLFELLPHETERFLVNTADLHFNAFDERLWPSDRAQHLPAIGQTQSVIRNFQGGPSLILYSHTVRTDKYYEIDDHFTLRGTYGFVKGDGTVSVASAVHGSDLSRRLPVKDAMHEEIQNHTDVLSAIAAELESHV